MWHRGPEIRTTKGDLTKAVKSLVKITRGLPGLTETQATVHAWHGTPPESGVIPVVRSIQGAKRALFVRFFNPVLTEDRASVTYQLRLETA